MAWKFIGIVYTDETNLTVLGGFMLSLDEVYHPQTHVSYLKRAWSILTSSPDTVMTLIGLFFIMCIPVVGIIYVMGFIALWAKKIAWGHKTMPRIMKSKLGYVLKSGLRVFAINVLMFLLALILSALFGAAPLFNLIFIVGGSLVNVLIYIQQLNATVYERFSAAFDFQNFSRIKSSPARVFGRVAAIIALISIVMFSIMNMLLNMVILDTQIILLFDELGSLLINADPFARLGIMNYFRPLSNLVLIQSMYNLIMIEISCFVVSLLAMLTNFMVAALAFADAGILTTDQEGEKNAAELPVITPPSYESSDSQLAREVADKTIQSYGAHLTEQAQHHIHEHEHAHEHEELEEQTYTVEKTHWDEAADQDVENPLHTMFN